MVDEFKEVIRYDPILQEGVADLIPLRRPDEPALRAAEDALIAVPDPDSTLVRGERVFASTGTSNPMGTLTGDVEHLKAEMARLLTLVEQ